MLVALLCYSQTDCLCGSKVYGNMTIVPVALLLLCHKHDVWLSSWLHSAITNDASSVNVLFAKWLSMRIQSMEYGNMTILLVTLLLLCHQYDMYLLSRLHSVITINVSNVVVLFAKWLSMRTQSVWQHNDCTRGSVVVVSWTWGAIVKPTVQCCH